MKCITKPRGIFRRPRPLGLPEQSCRIQSPLTPQHPQGKLTIVNSIARRSQSRSHDESQTGLSGGTGTVAGECAVADLLSDITRESEWYLLHVEKNLPCARSFHASLASRENVYVVGGASVDGPLSDVQVFNVDTFSWKELYPAGSQAADSRTRELEAARKNPRPKLINPAPSLSAPFAGAWRGKLITVGCEVSAPKNSPLTVHAFDISQRTWSVIKPRGDLPEARTGYRIVQVQSNLVMFGGEDASGRIVDDVYLFNLEMSTWVCLETTGAKPGPRRNPAMACYGDRYIWIYGGKSYATYYNDLYCLDLKQRAWIKVKVNGAIPTVPRAGHVGIIRGDSFYIVGGENRGNEMVDTLMFNIPNLTWSLVTSVHAMSPLAHNGLSVLKVSHEGRQYLVAFGGHGILLSCQMFALLLPSADEEAIFNSRSREQSLNTFSTRSTISEEETSPVNPFQFHGAASMSSSSWESDSPTRSTHSNREPRAMESLISLRKERTRIKTTTGSLDFEANMSWERTPQHVLKSCRTPLSGDLHQRSPLSNCLRRELSTPGRERSTPSKADDRSPLSQPGRKSCDDYITIEPDNYSGRLDTNSCVKDGRWGLRVLETKDRPHRNCDSPHREVTKAGHRSFPRTPSRDVSRTPKRSFPPTPSRKIIPETDVISMQLRAVVKAIRELQETQRSSLAKDEDLNLAMVTIKELEDEVRKLRRNKDDQENKVQQKSMARPPLVDKQSQRTNRTEFEYRNEVAGDKSRDTPEAHKKVTGDASIAACS